MTLLSPKNYLHLVIVFVSLCRISCSCEELSDLCYFSQILPEVEMILSLAFSFEIIAMLKVRPLVRKNGKYLIYMYLVYSIISTFLFYFLEIV